MAKKIMGGMVLAALTASLCCIIPLLFAGAGLTAIVIAERFATLRPYLLVVTGLLLLAGFYYAYRPGRASCEPRAACGTASSRQHTRMALWMAIAFALAITTFPYWSAMIVRNTASKGGVTLMQTTGKPTQTVTLRVSGLTCEGCGALLENVLLEHAGVHSARVSFSESVAEVVYNLSQTSVPEIRALIEKAGYHVIERTPAAAPKEE